MAWRVAKSLNVLLDQINAQAPKRSKKSDGSIGDAAHSSRASDHNPWVKDGKTGVVTARDYTHDPKNGFDAYAFAETLRANQDSRIKYVISNRRIFSGSGQNQPAWVWRKYNGVNPHDKHTHVSVKASKAHYDSPLAWDLGVPVTTQPVPIPLTSAEKLGVKLPVSGIMSLDEAKAALASLGYSVGTPAQTDRAIKAFQGSNKLKKDGIIGPMTSRALEKAVQAHVTPPVLPTPEPASASPGPIVGLEQTKNEVPDLSNPKEAVKFYQSLGWSKIQATVLVANLVWESGGNQDEPDTIRFNAKGDKDKDGHYQSYGAGQWNRKAGRFQKLDEFARVTVGSNWQDPSAQLQFLNHELMTPPYSKLGTMLRASVTLEEAMAICIKIWGPSDPHTDRRLAIARKLMG